MKEPNRYIVIIIFLVSLGLLFFARPKITPTSFGDSPLFEGKVVEILSEKSVGANDIAYLGATKIQTLLVEGKIEGAVKRVSVENSMLTVDKGDRVFFQKLADGKRFTMAEVSRTRGIMWLSIFFIVLVLLVSGKKGLNALVGLVFTFAVIISFLVPRILAGQNSIAVSLIGAILILVGTLYVTYGWNKKSFSALVGISLTLLFVSLLAQFTISELRFTGFASEEAAYLNQETGDRVNIIALLISGIIIAAIGVLDDVAITQASAVFTLASTKVSITRWDLFRKAMIVGKDHISAVINTLILAYTGAALPLVLLLSIGGNVQIGYTASLEIVAEEIVRTLVSSAGLVLAVPATTFVAVLLAKRK